jgi:hypothetical protein
MVGFSNSLFWRGGRQSEHSGLCSAAQRSLSHELLTSSSSHGIACSGDGDGDDEDSNSYSGGGGDDDYGGGGVNGVDGVDDGGGGGDTRTTATTTAAGTMALIAATTTTAAAVATVAATAAEVWRRRGGVCRDGCVGCRRWWSPENCKSHLAISPTARRHVFDAVLKHGWPSAPCHGATMVEKK